MRDVTAAGVRSSAIRKSQADARRDLAGARTRLDAWRLCADIVELPSQDLARLHVGRLIRMCRYTGWAEMRRFLLRAEIRFESKSLADLTDRQRAVLVADLRGER